MSEVPLPIMDVTTTNKEKKNTFGLLDASYLVATQHLCMILFSSDTSSYPLSPPLLFSAPMAVAGNYEGRLTRSQQSSQGNDV